ncbi:MAG: hypothetical protein AVDCRST_MAG18-3305, partial [uncultured Thermomicrobiales bacterium]
WRRASGGARGARTARARSTSVATAAPGSPRCRSVSTPTVATASSGIPARRRRWRRRWARASPTSTSCWRARRSPQSRSATPGVSLAVPWKNSSRPARRSRRAISHFSPSTPAARKRRRKHGSSTLSRAVPQTHRSRAAHAWRQAPGERYGIYRCGSSGVAPPAAPPHTGRSCPPRSR